MRRTIVIAVFVLAFVLFFLRSIVVLDPDFGWYLRMGQYIIAHGIPKTDPFSYTMSSYSYIDHEWGTNVLIALAYPVIGKIGLSAISAFFIALSLLLQFRLIPRSQKAFCLIPIILAISTLLSFTSIRPQVITWFFFSLLLVTFSSDKYWLNFRFALPFIFLLWANMHGGFAAGIFALIVFVLVKAYQKRNLKNIDVVLVFLSIILTFINPYGAGLWKEVWVHVADGSLRWSISEWLPAFFIPNLSIWIFISVSAIGTVHYRGKFSATQLVIYILLLIGGILSVRNIPLWIISAVPITSSAIFFFFKDAIKQKKGQERFIKAYRVFLVLIAVFVVLQAILDSITALSLSEDYFYPKNAVSFLQSHNFEGNLFSEYGWGGYLIWKLPNKKVFVDGRMPTWQWKSNLPKESNNAFGEYQEIKSLRIKMKNVSKKYNISAVMLSAKEKSGLEKQLVTLGWVEIYRDSVAIIYRQYHSIK